MPLSAVSRDGVPSSCIVPFCPHFLTRIVSRATPSGSERSPSRYGTSNASMVMPPLRSRPPFESSRVVPTTGHTQGRPPPQPYVPTLIANLACSNSPRTAAIASARRRRGAETAAPGSAHEVHDSARLTLSMGSVESISRLSRREFVLPMAHICTCLLFRTLTHAEVSVHFICFTRYAFVILDPPFLSKRLC